MTTNKIILPVAAAIPTTLTISPIDLDIDHPQMHAWNIVVTTEKDGLKGSHVMRLFNGTDPILTMRQPVTFDDNGTITGTAKYQMVTSHVEGLKLPEMLPFAKVQHHPVMKMLLERLHERGVI